MELKRTPFYKNHLEHKAKIVDYAGFALALEYQSMLAEAKAVRDSCGLFDASHMGEISISGKGASDFLSSIVTNDIASLKPKNMQYNLFLNDRAGVIDDCMIYNRGREYLCVVNAVNKSKVYEWIKERQPPSVDIKDKSDSYALLSLQGPGSVKIVEEVFVQGLGNLYYLSFIEFLLADSNIMISRSGYTGEDGFEIYLPWERAGVYWEKIVEAGKAKGLAACGLGSRDILRIEAGYSLYGHELTEDIDPYSAALGWAVKLDKDFIGRKTLLELREKGSCKKRVGFIMKEKGVPRQGYNVFHNGSCIGKVSSGTYSPNLEKFIGMAFIGKDGSGSIRDIQIEIRGAMHKAKVVKFPFVNTKVKVKK